MSHPCPYLITGLSEPSWLHHHEDLVSNYSSYLHHTSFHQRSKLWCPKKTCDALCKCLYFKIKSNWMLLLNVFLSWNSNLWNKYSSFKPTQFGIPKFKLVLFLVWRSSIVFFFFRPCFSRTGSSPSWLWGEHDEQLVGVKLQVQLGDSGGGGLSDVKIILSLQELPTSSGLWSFSSARSFLTKFLFSSILALLGLQYWRVWKVCYFSFKDHFCMDVSCLAIYLWTWASDSIHLKIMFPNRNWVQW